MARASLRARACSSRASSARASRVGGEVSSALSEGSARPVLKPAAMRFSAARCWDLCWRNRSVRINRGCASTNARKKPFSGRTVQAARVKVPRL